MNIFDNLPPRRHLPDAISRNSRVCDDMFQTLETLRKATASHNMELFLMDYRNKEIYRCPRHGIESYKAVRYKIGSGSTITAHVAGTLTPLVSHDVVKNKAFPLGVDRLGSAVKRALVVPILTEKKRLIGVMQLTRSSEGRRYTQLELEMCVNVCNWMVPSIEQYFWEENALIENSVYSSLIRATNACICGHGSHEEEFSKLMRITNRILNSESYILFIKYKSQTCLKNVNKVKLLIPEGDNVYKRKLCFDAHSVRSVASTVMLENRIVTATVKDFDSNYVSSMYDPLVVESSIGIPLVCHGSIKGALEFVNKIDSDRFYVEDRLVLSCITAFIEFNLFVGSLINRTRKTKLHMNIEHDKFKRALRLCKHEERKLEELKLQRSPEERSAVPTDETAFLFSFDRMFTGVMPDWTSYNPFQRVRFLSNILNFTLIDSCVIQKKLWASVEFVHDILKSYLPYFMDTEREVMMYAVLCRAINSPYCNDDCLPKEISTAETNVHDECNSFYFIRTLFQKTDLLDKSRLEPLMRKLKVVLHTLNLTGLRGVKENLFRVIAKKEFDIQNMDHRTWLRSCILAVAEQAIYFRPGLLPLKKIIELIPKIEAYSDDPWETIRRKRDIAKTLGLHLRLNVLPLMILLRIILPETKIYLVYCLRSIKACESYRPSRINMGLHDTRGKASTD